MKVITEERYKDFLSEISQFTPDEILWLADNLSSKFEEIDTLTVSKLRPMSDAPMDGEYFMAYCHPTEQKIGMFFPYRYDEDIDTYVDEDDEEMCVDVVLGWIPSPTFKPEKE